jgi:hypothetical protein
MNLGDEIEAELKSRILYRSNLKPSYNGYGVSNIPATISSLLGCRTHANPPLARKIENYDRSYSTVVLLLIDGLGWNLLKRSVKSSDNLAELTESFPPAPITTVFPSTTSTVITTLSTGRTPAEHGVVGYTMYVKQLGSIINMLDFKSVNSPKDDNIFDKGFPPEDFLGVPTFYQNLSKEGVQSFVLTKNYLLGSGLSRMTHIGAHQNGYVDVGDMFVLLRKLLENNLGLRKYVFVYWPSVDTASHIFGPWSEESAAEIRSLFFSMKAEFASKLTQDVCKDTLLMLTADHGQSQIPDEGVYDVSVDREFMDMLVMPPTGDSRTVFLHVKEGLKEKVEGHLRKRFGEAFKCMDVESAIEGGLFGPGEKKKGLRDSLGDTIILTDAGRAIFYPFKIGSSYNQRGAHSGLTEDELLVPYFGIPLSELRT